MELGNQKSQHWHLHGLGSMHRALVRRVADGIAAELSIKLIWHLHDSLPAVEAWYQPNPLGVSMIDCNLWLEQHSAANWPLDRSVDSTRAWSSDHVRLLWSWSRPFEDDAVWSASTGFAGLIRDVPTLNGWCRVAIDKGPHAFLQHNFLMRDIVLPTIE